MKKLLGIVSATIVIALFMANTSASTVASGDNIVLNENNIATLNDEVSGQSVGEVISGIRGLTKKDSKEPLYLFLDTPGGSVQSGLELIEATRGVNREIKTITLFAASMGFQIAQNLGERLILKNGVLMSHHARGEIAGEFGGQDPSQMQNRLDFWKERVQNLDEITVERTKGKQTIESYQKSYENELWLTGKKAVEQGYADKVVTVSCDKSLNGTRSKSINFLGMDISYDLDKCPLNTAPMNVRMKMETTKGIMDSNEFVKQGGVFGAACLLANDATKLCLIDTTITPAKIEEFKSRFVNQYMENKNKVVYMTFGK